jgi:hypothetical protein
VIGLVTVEIGIEVTLDIGVLAILGIVVVIAFDIDTGAVVIRCKLVNRGSLIFETFEASLPKLVNP